MKNTILIFHQLKRFVRTHRSFFFFYIMVQIIAVLILFFGAATIQSILIKEKELDMRTLIFEVTLYSYSETETEKIIVGYKETDGKKEPIYDEQQAIDYSNALSLDDMMEKANTIVTQSGIESPEYAYIAGKYENLRIHVPLFVSDQTQNGNTVKIQSGSFPDAEIGDKLEIGGQTYTVTEISDVLTYDIYITSGAIPDNLKWYRLRMGYAKAPTTSQVEKLGSLAKKLFNYSECILPPVLDPLTAQFNATTILCSFFMLLAVLINICYAQLYRFRLERHSLAIYRICGAGNNTICSTCISECLLISTLIYSVCAVAFNFLLKKSVAVWYSAAETLYTPKFYLLFGLSFLLLQVILLVIPLLRFINNEVVNEERSAS